MSAIALETPEAQALSSAVHSKIVDQGWTQDDDTSLAEYIVLMLANGKTQDQIASELAGELLQDADGTTEFAQWLFQQVDNMSGGAGPSQNAPQPQQESGLELAQESTDSANAESSIPAAYEMDMADSAPENAYVAQPQIHPLFSNLLCSPRGPKGLHGGRAQSNRGRGNHKSSDSALHRVRGNDRINTHGNTRGAPKGPRNSQGVRPGMQKALNNIGLAGQPPGIPPQMMPNPGQPGQNMPPMNPQQQMEFMAAMWEQQTRMLAQITGIMPENGGFPQGGQPQQNGRSLFDRVEPGRGRGGRGRGGRAGGGQNGHAKSNKQSDADTNMEGADQSSETTAMDVESTTSGQKKSQDPFDTMCHFNWRCTNKDCAYAHQSPVASTSVAVDMKTTCSFATACKNAKCTGRHPSPALTKAQQADTICKFFPRCTNPGCAFKHPSAPLCRFGDNCKTPNCTFTHLQERCRYNPCNNLRCPFKHEPGQQQAKTLGDYSWTPDKQAEKDAAKDNNDHVSDRKFVDEEAEEELIKPEGAGETANGAAAAEPVTA